MFSSSALLVSRITYVYRLFDSLRIFRHSSGPDKSGNIQSVITIFGRNSEMDARASWPSFAKATSYGCLAKRAPITCARTANRPQQEHLAGRRVRLPRSGPPL